jgi:hypothetical protein
MANEYDNFDFGFTAVDADELAQHTDTTTPATSDEVAEQVVTQVSAEMEEFLQSIDAKVNILVDKLTVEGQDFPADSLDIQRLEEKIDKIVLGVDESGETLPDNQNRIEEKLDQILAMENTELVHSIQEQGANIRAVIDEVEERKSQLNAVYREKMDELELLTLPLLYNLKNNPDKEYILWPNRTELINSQIEKIKAITENTDIFE